MLYSYIRSFTRLTAYPRFICKHPDELSPVNFKMDAAAYYRTLRLEHCAQLIKRRNNFRIVGRSSIFADKCDVAEEITRLKSHISQFIAAADESGPVGRKMDFICQEMGREINTTASKANNLELTKLAISLKNELERVREQVQNVE